MGACGLLWTIWRVLRDFSLSKYPSIMQFIPELWMQPGELVAHIFLAGHPHYLLVEFNVNANEIHVAHL